MGRCKYRGGRLALEQDLGRSEETELSIHVCLGRASLDEATPERQYAFVGPGALRSSRRARVLAERRQWLKGWRIVPQSPPPEDERRYGPRRKPPPPVLCSQPRSHRPGLVSQHEKTGILIAHPFRWNDGLRFCRAMVLGLVVRSRKIDGRPLGVPPRQSVPRAPARDGHIVTENHVQGAQCACIDHQR